MVASGFYRRHDRAVDLRLARLLRGLAGDRRLDGGRASSHPGRAGRMSEPERSAPRSAGTRRTRRPRLPWPTDREFRILSIDGGGIRGIFPAAVLAGLEE